MEPQDEVLEDEVFTETCRGEENDPSLLGVVEAKNNSSDLLFLSFADHGKNLIRFELLFFAQILLQSHKQRLFLETFS